jgi:hypothetical protein
MAWPRALPWCVDACSLFHCGAIDKRRGSDCGTHSRSNRTASANYEETGRAVGIVRQRRAIGNGYCLSFPLGALPPQGIGAVFY